MSDNHAANHPTQHPANPPVAAEGVVAAHPHAPSSKINKHGEAPIVADTLTKFSFKKDKETGTKRPTLELYMPIPTMDGIINGLADEKVAKLIQELVAAEVLKAAREQISDDKSPVNNQLDLDVSKLTLEYLANMPAAERRGGGISKEVWAAFEADYNNIMPEITKRTPEQVANASKLFVMRLQPCKTRKETLSFLQGMLELYVANTENLEDFQAVVEFLNEKIETFLAADESSLLANLGA